MLIIKLLDQLHRKFACDASRRDIRLVVRIQITVGMTRQRYIVNQAQRKLDEPHALDRLIKRSCGMLGYLRKDVRKRFQLCAALGILRLFGKCQKNRSCTGAESDQGRQGDLHRLVGDVLFMEFGGMRIKGFTRRSDTGKHARNALTQKQFIIDDTVSRRCGHGARLVHADGIEHPLCLVCLKMLLCGHDKLRGMPSDDQIKVAYLDGAMVENVRIHFGAAQIVKRLTARFEESFSEQIMAFFPSSFVTAVFKCGKLDFGVGHHEFALRFVWFCVHDIISARDCQVVFPAAEAFSQISSLLTNHPLCAIISLIDIM